MIRRCRFLEYCKYKHEKALDNIEKETKDELKNLKRKVDDLEKQASNKENVVELQNKVLKLEKFAEKKESKIIELENCITDTAIREADKNDSKRIKDLETKSDELQSNEENQSTRENK